MTTKGKLLMFHGVLIEEEATCGATKECPMCEIQRIATDEEICRDCRSQLDMLEAGLEWDWFNDG